MSTKNVDPGSSKSAASAMVPLPDDFTPCSDDVLCGRGKKNYNSIGNQKLRRIVESYVDQYSASSSRQDKSDILSTIVEQVRKASPKGGFIKQDADTKQWFEVGDFLAREKVSQTFRDCLSSHYRSSKKFKHEKRRQRDKAAKLAKQMQGQKAKGDGDGDGAASAAANAFVNRERLSVLREDTMMPVAAYIPPNQDNHAPRGTRTHFQMSEGASSLPYQGTRQSDVQPTFYRQPQERFNSQEMLASESMGNRHTSWPQLLHPESQTYHPVYTQQRIAQDPRGRFSGAMMPETFGQQRRHSEVSMPETALSQRRYSDTTMYHSEPNFPSWSLPMNDDRSPIQPYPGMPFLGGPASYAAVNNLGLQTNTRPMNPNMEVVQRQRPRPVQRGDSNVSTAATAIVSSLSGALPELAADQGDPFEPLPADSEDQGEQQQHHGSFPDW